MDRRHLAALLAALSFAACAPETPATSAPSVETTDIAAPAVAPVKPLDYAAPAHWVCRPEAEDACEQVATATSVFADGVLSPDTFAPRGDPPIDCFYVYPTVSRDNAGNADAAVGPEETEIVRQQLARFANVCRLFAPLYRQVTLTALQKMRRGEDAGSDREMAYADIKAAWAHYLAADNTGRGVVLIGHSQGAGILTRLIASEIDGKPIADRLVSALLIGGGVEAPDGLSAGGTFRTIPLCTAGDSTGCVIAYSSFRADAPPPENSLFGAAATDGLRVACVNPAELDGSGGQLKALLPNGAMQFAEIAPPPAWTAANPQIGTPFVAVPGLLSARCVTRGPYNYLAITVNADPLDPRTDTISGDVVVDGAIRPEWGLHLIDMHLALGNLVDLVARQSAAWRSLQTSAAALPPEFHGEPH